MTSVKAKMSTRTMRKIGSNIEERARCGRCGPHILPGRLPQSLQKFTTKTQWRITRSQSAVLVSWCLGVLVVKERRARSARHGDLKVAATIGRRAAGGRLRVPALRGRA